MTSDPGTLVRTAFDRLNEHDLDGYYALLAEDVTYVGVATTRGRDAARATDAPVFAMLPDHSRRVDRMLVSGDTVAAWLVFSGTHAATGERFEAEFCDILEIRGGFIQSITMYADWAALLPLLGG